MTPRARGPEIAAGYARVSTADQSREGVSLDAQRDRITQYCATHGITLAIIYVDASVSGGTPLAQRDAGSQLAGAIGRREITTVVALKLDRLFRSTIDALQVVEHWDRRRVALHLVDFGGASLDTRSAMGKMMLTIGAAFGELERSLIAERTSAALQHMKRTGVRLGGVPFGFRVTVPGGELEPEADELATAREIVRLRTAGGPLSSYRAIARHLTVNGWPTRHGGDWKAETVRRIVERAAVYGRVTT